ADMAWQPLHNMNWRSPTAVAVLACRWLARTESGSAVSLVTLQPAIANNTAHNQYFTKKPPHPGYGGYYAGSHPGARLAFIATMSNIVTALLVQHDIQSLGFLLDTDPQRAEQGHQLQQHPGDYGGVQRHHHHTEQLHAKLLQHAVAFQREAVAGECTQAGGGKHRRRQRAEHAADTVHREYIERIINLQFLLDEDHHVETHHTGNGTNHQRTTRANKPGRRRNGAKAGDHAGGNTERRRLAEFFPFDKHPRQ